MPIKGLSDVRRFSRGGKIRLGEKKVSQGGKEYPSKLDYMLADFDNPQLEQEYYALYGQQPKRIPVMFGAEPRRVTPAGEPEDFSDIFPQDYCCYGASGLLCKGDGDRAMQRSADDHRAEIVEVDCLGPGECEFSLSRGKSGRPGCKRLARLRFFLPDLHTTDIFEIDTTSWNSIVNINSALPFLWKAFGGRISGIPLELSLRPQQATNPENGKKVNIYVLCLSAGVSLRELSTVKPLLLEPGRQLPPPSDDMPEGLYPASLSRAQAAYAENGEGFTIDAETGEVTDAPDEPEPEDLGNDADVVRAFEDAGFPPAKRNAMLASATDKAALLHIISVNAANGNGRTAKPAAKKEAKPQPPKADAADDPLADGATLF